MQWQNLLGWELSRQNKERRFVTAAVARSPNSDRLFHRAAAVSNRRSLEKATRAELQLHRYG